MKYRKGDEPRFLGSATVMGDFGSFACSPLVNTPASIDLWLGHAPGTTTSPPCRAYAIAGAFVGQSSAAVQAQIDALSGLAGATGPFGYPTGIRFPDDFYWSPRYCYFLAAEFVPGSIATAPGNTYSATYRLVLRVCPPG